MLRVAVTFLLLCMAVTVMNAARAEPGPAGDGLFRETLTLETGQVLVIEESSLEPRSIGSFTVRLYSGANANAPYDDFRRGLLLKRDGVLESARVIPPENGKQRVLLTVRSVGTGDYPSYHLLTIAGDRIRADSYRSGRVPPIDVLQEQDADSGAPAETGDQ